MLWPVCKLYYRIDGFAVLHARVFEQGEIWFPQVSQKRQDVYEMAACIEETQFRFQKIAEFALPLVRKTFQK